jgi:hypothetical protein
VVRPDDPLRTCACGPRTSRSFRWSMVIASSASSTRVTCSARYSRGLARAFDLPVKEAMVTRLETISADAAIRELVPLFRRDLVAIVMDAA